MKIGISSSSVYQDELIYARQPKEPLILDFPVPKIVRKSLELAASTIPCFGKNPPIARYASQGHGDDYGLVFIFDEGNVLGDERNAKKLVARISYGLQGEPIRIGDTQITYKDPCKLCRLHLNVYGERKFLNRDEKGKTGTYYRSENSFVSFYSQVRETLHFSLRWIGNSLKTDFGWNEPLEWLRQMEKDLSERPHFNSMRTSFTSFSEHLLTPEKRVSESLDEKLSKPKSPSFPRNISKQQLMELFPEGTTEEVAAKAYGFIRTFYQEKEFPVVGYSPVLKILSNFGEVSETDSDSLTDITPEQGIEYIFGKVLPAMRKFTDQ